jgi:hypothetical protein
MVEHTLLLLVILYILNSIRKYQIKRIVKNRLKSNIDKSALRLSRKLPLINNKI